jgi:ubiquitin-conjugating enzyme E2 variant
MTLILSWLLADLISGLVHWFEDKYLDESTSVGRDNVLHHTDPEAMTRISWFKNIDGSLVFAIPITCALVVAGAPVWLSTAIMMASTANLVHRWAHERRDRVPTPVRWCQSVGLMVSPRRHNKHHRDVNGLISKAAAKDTYCAMTDWLNPVLNYIGLWEKMEWVLGIYGLKKV